MSAPELELKICEAVFKPDLLVKLSVAFAVLAIILVTTDCTGQSLKV